MEFPYWVPWVLLQLYLMGSHLADPKEQDLHLNSSSSIIYFWVLTQGQIPSSYWLLQYSETFSRVFGENLTWIVAWDISPPWWEKQPREEAKNILSNTISPRIKELVLRSRSTDISISSHCPTRKIGSDPCSFSASPQQLGKRQSG